MTAMASRPAGGGKMLCLELIRFLSALAVLFWHYQHFGFVADRPVDFVRTQQPLYGLFSVFYEYGYLGVQVFWCLSGFIFFWKYRTALADGTIGPGRFFLLRFSRLYPLHIVTLLLVAALQLAYVRMQGHYFVYQHNDLWHFVLQLFLASHWGLERGYSFNGPIWSISVEVVAYLAFFLALRFVGRSVWIKLAMVLAFVAANRAQVSTPIFDCLGLFCAGGLGAVARSHWQHGRHAARLQAALALALAIVPWFPWQRVVGDDRAVHLFLLCYLPALFYLCAQDPPLPPWMCRTIEVAGNMTYSSYLVHFPIQLALAGYFAFQQQAIPYQSTALFGVFMTATLVAAYFLYRLFELPAQNYLRTRYSTPVVVNAKFAD